MTNEFAEWITKNLAAVRLQQRVGCSEEKYSELEQEFGVHFPADYKLLHLLSDGMVFYGTGDNFNCYSLEATSLANDDPAYTDYLDGLFIIGDDNGDNFYAYDPKNKWKHGSFAIFRLDAGSFKKESSIFIAPDLRSLLIKLNEGVVFSTYPKMDSSE